MKPFCVKIKMKSPGSPMSSDLTPSNTSSNSQDILLCSPSPAQSNMNRKKNKKSNLKREKSHKNENFPNSLTNATQLPRQNRSNNRLPINHHVNNYHHNNYRRYNNYNNNNFNYHDNCRNFDNDSYVYRKNNQIRFQ